MRKIVQVEDNSLIDISKFKLIKFYLRSTMSQERLNGLTILSIEKILWKTSIIEKLLPIDL